MTKAAMCLTCGQIIGPRPRKENWTTWTWCGDPCAHTAVRWRDGEAGLLEVTSLHGPAGVVIIGLHNGMIANLDRPRPGEHSVWRAFHDAVTNAPGYLFDKTKRDCWAVLIRPGESNDTFFMPYADAWAERSSETNNDRT